MADRLRGYVVTSKWEESAVLVFAPTAREAKRMGWRIIVHDYMEADFYTDVRVRWAREADPEAWGVTESCILEPEGCEACERWYPGAPVVGGLCEPCRDDEELETFHG